MKVAVILGSVRPYRMGPRVGKMVLAELEKRGHQSTLFDPAEIKLPLLEKPLHWHAPNEEKPQILVQTYESLKSHDAFIIVTPEYNFNLPPALTNFIDHFPYDTWRWRFGSIISYSMGNFGGIVAQQQLRTMCGITSLVALPSTVTIPNVQNQIEEDGTVVGERRESIEKNLKKQMDELEFFSEAIITKKETSSVPFE